MTLTHVLASQPLLRNSTRVRRRKKVTTKYLNANVILFVVIADELFLDKEAQQFWIINFCQVCKTAPAYQRTSSPLFSLKHY